MTHGRQMRRRVGQVRDVTITDLVKRVAELGQSPDNVMLTAAHLVWHSPETDEEVEARTGYEAAAAARTAKWERDTYERLKVKAREEGWDA